VTVADDDDLDAVYGDQAKKDLADARGHGSSDD
jgi:hypothetical protein